MGPQTEHSEIDFEHVFKSNYTAMYRCAHNLVKDQDLAKDIVQEVFLKCWNKGKDLGSITNLTGYLITATTRTAYNHLRDNKSVTLHDLSLPEVVNRSSNLNFSLLEYTELELQVEKAILKLPVQCRVIFQLSRQEGLTYQQIAESLEVSVKTVEKQMGIALYKLRESLKPFLTMNVSALILTVCGSTWQFTSFFGFFNNSI